jgi:hypothetical protein
LSPKHGTWRKLIHTSLDTVPVDKLEGFRSTTFLEWNNSRATLYPHARPIAADGDPVILSPSTFTTTCSHFYHLTRLPTHSGREETAPSDASRLLISAEKSFFVAFGIWVIWLELSNIGRDRLRISFVSNASKCSI